MKKILRVCLAQLNTTVGDIDGNCEKIVRALSRAKGKQASLVVFPELTLTGYPPEDLLFKKGFVSKNLEGLDSLLPYTRGLKALVGYVDRDKEGRLYNAAALISDQKKVHVYRKTELPNYGVFDEKRYFTAGTKKGWLNFDGVRWGLSICEDIWQENSWVYRKKNSCSVLVNLSASPYHRGKQKERQGLLKNLALKKKSFVVYLNLVGGQDELVFDGGSLVLDPQGRVIAEAKRFEEDFLVVELKPSSKPSSTKIENSVEEVYKALVLGTRDYVQKSRHKKVLIGLSGGVDSALVARIAADALGPDRVVGVTMPSPFTSKETLRDAKKLCRKLDMECLELKIHPIFKNYLGLLKHAFFNRPPDTTEENLQARIRGNLLMALSNKFNHLVLTTGNKSEMATGYCTLYGDMAGGFAVIKDVPKTLVYELANYRNRLEPKNSIPLSIIRRAPTAELRPNQKDQDTLPPYKILDRFLELYVEQDLSLEEIVKKGIPKKIVEETARRVDRNEYKRRQAPPGIKITPKAFGRDRRMPIINQFAQ